MCAIALRPSGACASVRVISSRCLFLAASSCKRQNLYLSATSRIHELTPEERAVYATLTPSRLPEHVAIIMDGNGRWAGARSLKRFLGHQQGAKSVQLVTETASRIGLPWLTLYAFSLENNLRRPRAEVNFLR